VNHDGFGWPFTEHAIATFAADRRKVFVTGLSAGGAMASVMLATYPEVFAVLAMISPTGFG
jgi:poly(3-hydroxybutyrate) depolymerase